MLNLNTQIKIGEKIYNVSYPNVRQKINIETMKMFLSQNTYGNLIQNNHRTALELLDLVDAVSYFCVLIPEIGQNMRLEQFENLDFKVQRNYVKAFKEELFPWMSKLEKEMNDLDSIEQEFKSQSDEHIGRVSPDEFPTEIEGGK